MQQILGTITVANAGNNNIYSLNNMNIYVPNILLSYYLINTQEQAFYTDMLFCLEDSHQYIVNSVPTQINYILNSFNPDTITFKDFALEVRRNMSRTFHLSFTFTAVHNQPAPIYVNTILTVLRDNLETIKYDSQKPLTYLEHAALNYKEDFRG